jgi:hypothetical protein
MPCSLMRAAIFSLLLLPPANAQTTPVRHPQGVYSFFIVDLTAGAERTANPSITSAQLHLYAKALRDRFE